MKVVYHPNLLPTHCHHSKSMHVRKMPARQVINYIDVSSEDDTLKYVAWRRCLRGRPGCWRCTGLCLRKLDSRFGPGSDLGPQVRDKVYGHLSLTPHSLTIFYSLPKVLSSQIACRLSLPTYLSRIFLHRRISVFFHHQTESCYRITGTHSS